MPSFSCHLSGNIQGYEVHAFFVLQLLGQVLAVLSLKVNLQRVCNGGCHPAAPLSLPEVSRYQLSKLFTFKIYNFDYSDG
jgi:hypothetical protein